MVIHGKSKVLLDPCTHNEDAFAPVYCGWDWLRFVWEMCRASCELEIVCYVGSWLDLLVRVLPPQLVATLIERVRAREFRNLAGTHLLCRNIPAFRHLVIT